MEKAKSVELLKSAVEIFDIDFAVLANINGTVLNITNKEKAEAFLSLYNASFFDAVTIQCLHENLKISTLPQMTSQGEKFCYLGLLEESHIYGMFGKTDKTVKEQYFFSKEIDKFLHLQLSI